MHMALCYDDNNTEIHKEQFCTLMVLLSVKLLDTSPDPEEVTCDIIRL